mmetsp:Transcript_19153/g.34765  ORF Transcript_19153/g.34765 Transcript_19153/m.34765 type:complete len:316 (+) Transcript_19153:109-1056(+)
MEAQNQKKQAAADLKKNLDSLAKNGRFTVAERVNHIRKTQKVDGIEIYAVQHTTIQRAAQTDNVAGVRFFIVKGHLDNKDASGATALHEAARFGYHNVVNELAEAGADVHQRNNIGQAAVHLCVAGGHPHILELLAGMGADLAAPDSGGASPAHYAAQVNRTDILEALYRLQARPLGPAVLSAASTNGLTPAHIAAQFGCVEALDLMHRSGVDLGARDAFGETPAHKSARAQHWKCVQALQRMGGAASDFTCCNVEEDTPNDLLVDKSRFWSEGDGAAESAKSLRELAKLRRDGAISQSDFRQMSRSAIDSRGNV